MCTTTWDKETLQQHHRAAVHVERLRPKVEARVEVGLFAVFPLQVVDAPAAPLRRHACRKTPSESCSPSGG